MSVTLTPRTDNFDRLEYPKGTYPLAGDWWVPIDDARNIEIELIEMTRAHDNAVAQCRETIRELAQARAELAAERERAGRLEIYDSFYRWLRDPERLVEKPSRLWVKDYYGEDLDRHIKTALLETKP